VQMSGLSEVDIKRMRDQLFFEGPERNRRLSRYWLLPLAAVIASAGVVSDSTATVIGAMIVAPMMTRSWDRAGRRAGGRGKSPPVRGDAGWSVTGVIATGDQVFIEATGPNPAPGLTLLRDDLDAAGLDGLDVRVNLAPASFQPVPK
jgi:hypothetical protein